MSNANRIEFVLISLAAESLIKYNVSESKIEVALNLSEKKI